MGTAKGGYEGFLGQEIGLCGEASFSRSLSAITGGLETEIPSGPELVADKIARLTLHILRNPGRAFSVRYSITSSTEFGWA